MRTNCGKCCDCGKNTDLNNRTGQYFWRCISCRKKASQKTTAYTLASPQVREDRRIRSKAWYNDHKADALEQSKKRWSVLRQKVFDLYGTVCNCCRESSIEFLTLDHVQNDGSVDRRMHSKYAIYVDAIKSYQPDKYQILCWNCNLAKHQYGECPHSRILR